MAATVTTIRRRSALAAALLLMSGTLAACGGSSSDNSSSSSGAGSTAAQSGGSSSGTANEASTTSSSAAGGSALQISAVEKGEDSLGFSQRALTARAGTVTIRLANGGSDEYPHGIAIEGNGVDKDGPIIQPGATSTVTVRLKPGTYTFYCPVGEHEKYGMKGTLTVS